MTNSIKQTRQSARLIAKNAESPTKNGSTMTKSTKPSANTTSLVAKSIPRIKILAIQQNRRDAEALNLPFYQTTYRVLVDGRFIKYFPSLPLGDWNQAHYSKNPIEGDPYCVKASNLPLQAIENIWHPVQIDLLDFKLGHTFHFGTMLAASSRFDSNDILKTAEFPVDVHIFEDESDIYEKLQGDQVAPQFLGHVTEHGRDVGMILEYIENGHYATIEDLTLCQQVLAKLHKLHLLHGDVHKYQFIIRGGRAFLIDFATARHCGDSKLLEEEFQSLEKQLLDDSGFGRPDSYLDCYNDDDDNDDSSKLSLTSSEKADFEAWRDRGFPALTLYS
ncbi:MAG: hypothetical protein M1829_000350 [Trizodia sp. TS-e1964]|nr:MAG: hypothetical protein M1829_000350 [Trizodia sp. TS-e1964]